MCLSHFMVIHPRPWRINQEKTGKNNGSTMTFYASAKKVLPQVPHNKLQAAKDQSPYSNKLLLEV